jgi:hypothetical protein
MTSLDFVIDDQDTNSIHSNHLVARILQDYSVEVIKACKRAGRIIGSHRRGGRQKPREMLWKAHL